MSENYKRVSDYIIEVRNQLKKVFGEYGVNVRLHKEGERHIYPEAEIRVKSIWPDKDQPTDARKRKKAEINIIVRMSNDEAYEDVESEVDSEELPQERDAGLKMLPAIEDALDYIENNDFNCVGFEAAGDVESFDLNSDKESDSEEWLIEWEVSYLSGEPFTEEDKLNSLFTRKFRGGDRKISHTHDNGEES